MDYKEAKEIRKKSFGTLLAEQEGGFGTSMKKAIGLKTKAKTEGIKQFFDPMNIAKFMTFGSNWAPAMLGKATGRKQESINFFTGARKKGERAEQLQDTKNTADKIKSTSTGGRGFDATLEKIYNLMNKSFEDETKRREEANNYKEENELEKLKRHKELVEAITGKPYTGKATATKVTQDAGGSLLETLLGGRAVVQTLMSVLGWFASPVGLALLGAASMVALIALIKFGLEKLAENTPNMKALSPDEAQAILQNGSARDIEAMGGREKLEDIIKNGKKNAQDILNMPETTEEEKEAKRKAMLAAGGEDKVKAIAADEKVYEVPPQRSDAELGIKENVPPKADFIAGKPGTGGKNLARGVRAAAWDEKYGKDYNEDGTKKTATPAPAPAATPASTATETTPETSSGGASPTAGSTATPSAGGGASTATAAASTPTSAALPSASSENAALNLPSSTPDASTTVNSAAVNSSGSNAPTKNPIAPVRNLEPSFRNMIIGSTRTV
jgi:hypothetical protein